MTTSNFMVSSTLSWNKNFIRRRIRIRRQTKSRKQTPGPRQVAFGSYLRTPTLSAATAEQLCYSFCVLHVQYIRRDGLCQSSGSAIAPKHLEPRAASGGGGGVCIPFRPQSETQPCVVLGSAVQCTGQTMPLDRRPFPDPLQPLYGRERRKETPMDGEFPQGFDRLCAPCSTFVIVPMSNSEGGA